jgi:hypothetical protein
MNFTVNIWIDYLFSDKLKFRKVKNPDALEKFAQSLGWKSLENRFKDVIMTLKSQDKSTIAVVGATHFAATYKTEYLQNIPKQNTKFQLGGTSEGLYLDKPPFDLDGYLLSTYNNFAYHIGNTVEDFITQNFSNLVTIKSKSGIHSTLKQNPKKSIIKVVAEKLFSEIIDGNNGFLISNPESVTEIKNLILKALKNYPRLEQAQIVNFELARSILNYDFNKVKVLNI